MLDAFFNSPVLIGLAQLYLDKGKGLWKKHPKSSSYNQMVVSRSPIRLVVIGSAVHFNYLTYFAYFRLISFLTFLVDLTNLVLLGKRVN